MVRPLGTCRTNLDTIAADINLQRERKGFTSPGIQDELLFRCELPQASLDGKHADAPIQAINDCRSVCRAGGRRQGRAYRRKIVSPCHSRYSLDGGGAGATGTRSGELSSA